MKVPLDLLENQTYSGKGDEIYVATYIEHKPSKIYTNLHENLLVIVLHGKKVLKYHKFSTEISKGEYGFFKKGNYIMNQILNENNELYQSLLIFIGDDYLTEFKNQAYFKPKSTNVVEYYKNHASETMLIETRNIIDLIENSNQLPKKILKHKIEEMLLYITMNDKSDNFLTFIDSFQKKNDEFKMFVEKDYAQYTDLSAFSNAYGVSLSTFKRKFNEHYGMTPGKWINNQKLEKAQNLLSITDYSITDIGYISGFESLSTFMSQFKIKFGITPGTYKKLNHIRYK